MPSGVLNGKQQQMFRKCEKIVLVLHCSTASCPRSRAKSPKTTGQWAAKLLAGLQNPMGLHTYLSYRATVQYYYRMRSDAPSTNMRDHSTMMLCHFEFSVSRLIANGTWHWNSRICHSPSGWSCLLRAYSMQKKITTTAQRTQPARTPNPLSQ